jgi:acyl carrier protein
VHLSQLPLTINGKIDRKALPEAEFKGSESYVAPRTEREKQVCEIWSEVLGLPKEKVGIQDDFFRLGGNSILAIRLVNKLNKELKSQLRVSTIFQKHTVEKLTKYLELEIKNAVVIHSIPVLARRAFPAPKTEE